jgi:GAF domain-containing protein
MTSYNEQRKKVLHNLERLNVLRDLALIDAEAETVYDRITNLASKVIGVPVSLVSMVGADYQFFKSYVGLPEPWASNRRTPLSHSFCQHVVATNEPLIVSDARESALLRDNQAIPDLDVIGYLGMPLTLSDGKRLGSFCVIDSQPHTWSQLEIDIVQELAQIVTQEIDLRASIRAGDAQQADLDAAHATIDRLLDGLDTDVSQADFLAQLREMRQALTV